MRSLRKWLYGKPTDGVFTFQGGTMASQASKKNAQERRAQIEKMRAEQARLERKRKVYFGVGAGVLVLALVAGLIALALSKKNNNTPAAQTNTTPNALAQTWDGLTGQTVDGVSAQTQEQLAYHIHAHLAIYVNGKQKLVPAGIGIVKPWTTEQLQDGSQFVDGGKQLYYLHTHDSSGVLHVESPTTKEYTLGQIFAEWNQPLSTGQVGPASGTVITYVNGQKYTGNPSDIKLTPHEVIQLDVGQDVAFQPYAFASGL
ncbi:hypothetical protein [Actinocrinis sp.]|uniref:hypothetical protein n=1 Tax=Actinocrinis sp. TaxID=1920516 RepID=UPI002C11BF19|nr:hypothetical protein [Actinocrinis sp.]HXR72266.1 hypothetical protein [Actinocrinis sp.]